MKILFWIFGIIISWGLITFGIYLFWALKTLCDDLEDTDPWWYIDVDKTMKALNETLKDVK